jgi:hypothetical protein
MLSFSLRLGKHSWNIGESGVKHHKSTQPSSVLKCIASSLTWKECGTRHANHPLLFMFGLLTYAIFEVHCGIKYIKFFFTSRKLIFSLCNKMENNQYHTVGTFLEFNRKTIERGKITLYPDNPQSRGHSLPATVECVHPLCALWFGNCH